MCSSPVALLRAAPPLAGALKCEQQRITGGIHSRDPCVRYLVAALALPPAVAAAPTAHALGAHAAAACAAAERVHAQPSGHHRAGHRGRRAAQLRDDFRINNQGGIT